MLSSDSCQAQGTAADTFRDSAVFVVISFEGPDLWSQAGGLGVRVTGLAEALAATGNDVHVFYIGDPALAGEERRGNLTLHRWSQWISRHYRAGVYDGEEHKRCDLTASLPAYVCERILMPAIRAGRVPIVLLEEWQTAEAATLIADLLVERGVRDRAIITWNANNAYSFDRIDWPRLAGASTITTVSRHMRSIIRARGIDALVVPNGIPDRLTEPVNRMEVHRVRASFSGMPFFFKMARWGDDKGWIQALDAVRLLRERGDRTLLVARSGGPNGSGAALDGYAYSRGLRVVQVERDADLGSAAAEAAAGAADVLSLRFGVNEALARRIYAAADGTLANSVSEPFGLVGLEAMAAGGVLYTGGTGEDYAVSGRNAVVLETLQPAEIADRAQELRRSPDDARRLRRAARASARHFSWMRAAQKLFGVLAVAARHQGLRLQA